MLGSNFKPKTKFSMASAPAAYLVFAILVSSISLSSPSRAAGGDDNLSPPLSPPPKKLLRPLLFPHHSSLPPSPLADDSPVKPFRRLKDDGIDACPSGESNNGQKGDKGRRGRKPWPKCYVPESPPPNF